MDLGYGKRAGHQQDNRLELVHIRFFHQPPSATYYWRTGPVYLVSGYFEMIELNHIILIYLRVLNVALIIDAGVDEISLVGDAVAHSSVVFTIVEHLVHLGGARI